MVHQTSNTLIFETDKCMKRLQIVDYNINIGHLKVYSRDFVTYILWFIKLLNFEFRIMNFRIINSEFQKKLWMEIVFLEMPHQGPCTGWGKGSKIRTIQTIV